MDEAVLKLLGSMEDQEARKRLAMAILRFAKCENSKIAAQSVIGETIIINIDELESLTNEDKVEEVGDVGLIGIKKE